MKVIAVGVFFLIAMAALLALASMAAVPAMATTSTQTENVYSPKTWTAEKIGSLPLSNHALDGTHTVGADVIQEWMARKVCKPLMVYICKGVQRVKVVCPNDKDPNELNGLIIGTRDPANPGIVTGYPAEKSYWKGSGNRDGCIGPIVVP